MHRFHRPRRSLIAIPLALILITAMSVGYTQHIASAQDDSNASHPGHIHTGTCETLGDIVFPLSNVSAEALVDGSPSAGAAPVGAASAIQPKASQTNVQASLTDIVEGGHTIVVHESDEAIQNYIACGDIGGVMFGNTDLVIGLAELNDSDQAGTAWLHDNGYGTTMVTVYIFDLDQLDDGGEDDGTDEDADDDEADDDDTAGAAPPAAAAAVAIENFAFNPQTIEIAVGDTVTWTNNDTAQHTVTQSPSGSGFQSGGLAQGATFEQTFDTAGTFDYFCEFHSGMTGTVVVS